MEKTLEMQICEKLQRFVSSNITLAEFNHWFTPRTWDTRKMEDENLENLANEIELRIAEYSNGDWTKKELKEILKPLVTPKVYFSEYKDPVSLVIPRVTYTSSEVFRSKISINPPLPARTRFSRASVR